MILLKNISFSYPNDDFHLKINSLHIKAGESIALVGESGSGKSTLMKIISGEIQTAQGEVIINGEKLHQLNENKKRVLRLKSMGMILQDSALLEYLNLQDNILFPAKITGHKIEAKTLDELTHTCGIEKLLKKKPLALSEGEKQRAAVCRALINSPSIILADEPTSSLDPKNGDTITHMLIQQCKKNAATLLMITHNERLLSQFDRVIKLEELAGANHV